MRRSKITKFDQLFTLNRLFNQKYTVKIICSQPQPMKTIMLLTSTLLKHTFNPCGFGQSICMQSRRFWGSTPTERMYQLWSFLIAHISLYSLLGRTGMLCPHLSGKRKPPHEPCLCGILRVSFTFYLYTISAYIKSTYTRVHDMHGQDQD